MSDRIPAPRLEVCAETLQACSTAFHGGAHRIEICAALAQGGLTPSHGLIRGAIDAANGLPVFVLLRPRPGNFVYSNDEFKMMCADLDHAAAIGASGFVAGILTPQRIIDEARMSALIRLAGTKEVTFHRAFDHTPNLKQSLEQVIAIGCRRLLTSGGHPAVRDGMHNIADLSKQAGTRLRIAAGGGVTPEIARRLRRLADVDLHVSLRPRTADSDGTQSDPLWNPGNESAEISLADVQRMAAILNECEARNAL